MARRICVARSCACAIQPRISDIPSLNGSAGFASREAPPDAHELLQTRGNKTLRPTYAHDARGSSAKLADEHQPFVSQTLNLGRNNSDFLVHAIVLALGSVGRAHLVVADDAGELRSGLR